MGVYKGWNAEIYLDNMKVGCCESAKVEISTSLENYYCVGSKDAFDIVEGNKEITGSISRAWINSYYLGLITGSTLSEFDLCFYSTVAAVYVYCYDCKFEKGSIDIPSDGILKEDYDFRAKTIWVTPAS
jgi:hypothetical protein